MDFAFFWKESHLSALLVLATWLGLVSVYELRTRHWPLTSIIGIIVLCYALAGIAGDYLPNPPIPPIIGWLQPANEPTPNNDCNTRSQDDALLLILGNTGYIMPKRMPSVDALTLGWCHSLILHATENGVAIDAEIFDQDGKKVGYVQNNGYHIDGDLTVEKSGDLSTIVIHDSAGNEIIWVKYLNERTIRVRGHFFCTAPRPISVTVTDHAILTPGNNTINGGCLSGRMAVF